MATAHPVASLTVRREAVSCEVGEVDRGGRGHNEGMSERGEALECTTDGADPESQYVEIAAEVFSMLADATRVRLILVLRGGESSVNELAERVGKSPAAVSQHLAKLRLAHLVLSRQEGTRVYYRLANPHAARLVVDAMQQAAHATDAQPLGHEEPAEQ